MLVRAIDVAAYILRKRGPMPAMKLQKLVYYAQAWSLVWDGKLLFRDRIEAWANGPVIRNLYKAHRGKFQVSRILDDNPRPLNDIQRETVDAVLDFYGDKPPHWLSELTHNEAPWKDARDKAGLAPGVRGNERISPEAMEEYHSSLLKDIVEE